MLVFQRSSRKRRGWKLLFLACRVWTEWQSGGMRGRETLYERPVYRKNEEVSEKQECKGGEN